MHFGITNKVFMLRLMILTLWTFYLRTRNLHVNLIIYLDVFLISFFFFFFVRSEFFYLFCEKNQTDSKICLFNPIFYQVLIYQAPDVLYSFRKSLCCFHEKEKKNTPCIRLKLQHTNKKTQTLQRRTLA